MVTDTISDMLTRIRNANSVHHHMVQIPMTKMNINIANVLKSEGFISDFEILEHEVNPFLLISLKYKGTKQIPVITKIKRVSKPGLRIYAGCKDLPDVLGNLGIAIISTSSGIMSNIQARKLGIGGEILCYIW